MGREYSSVPANLLLWSACLATQQPAAQSVPAPVPKTLWGVGANQTKVGGDAILGRYLNKTGPGGLDQAVKPPASLIYRHVQKRSPTLGRAYLGFLEIS